ELVRRSQMTPLKLLWHGQDETVLRCLIKLYFCNHLPTDGGVSRSVLRLPFERHEVARFGEYAVWGFRQIERRALGDTALVKAFDVFCDSGLSTQVPHLCLSDHPEADVIHPYGTEPTSSLEDRIGHAAHQAGLALISAEQRRWVEAEGLWLAPVSLSIPRVAMVGVARLQHQPETQTTLDWQRKLVEITPGIIAGYDRLVASAG